ncbi:hypothetical protein HK101_001063 [Irineochytrium annulatum]|nr:hypothetical protein HK101_001063 [Irineochytrium annulatum]
MIFATLLSFAALSIAAVSAGGPLPIPGGSSSSSSSTSSTTTTSSASSSSSAISSSTSASITATASAYTTTFPYSAAPNTIFSFTTADESRIQTANGQLRRRGGNFYGTINGNVYAADYTDIPSKPTVTMTLDSAYAGAAYADYTPTATITAYPTNLAKRGGIVGTPIPMFIDDTYNLEFEYTNLAPPPTATVEVTSSSISSTASVTTD